MKNHFIILLFILFPAAAFTQQPRFSLATDISFQRSFKKEQQYWALGHSTFTNFHLTPKDGIYVSFAYYSNGNFSNNVTATAKSPLTVPQQINYVNKGNMRLKQFATGWKRYLKGTSEEEKKWAMYGYAGFGLLLGKITNTHSVAVDTVDYNVPVRSGKANFKRLTLDLGLGVEFPLGADFYIYTEGKAWIPTTDYPSKYIFVNDNAPVAGMFSAGLRLLF